MTHDNIPTIRPEVAAFALLMEQKLRENDRTKGNWRECPWITLFNLLDDERSELWESVYHWSPESVPLEAADVGNFAMFIPDSLGLLKLPDGVTALRIEEVRR